MSNSRSTPPSGPGGAPGLPEGLGRLWKPRHRGRKLAHHLVPAFVVAGFLLALGVAALAMGALAFGVAALALAAAAGAAIVREFRGHRSVQAPETSAVETSSGPRAATRFAMASVSWPGSAITVGLAVVVMVAALALAAKYLLLHDGSSRFLAVGASAAVLVLGLGILREGLRLARMAANDTPPGVYLTRSRIVVSGQRGDEEIYWNDVASVSAENPRGRAPLGTRGPAFIVLRRQPPGEDSGLAGDDGDSTGSEGSPTVDDGGLPGDDAGPAPAVSPRPRRRHRDRRPERIGVAVQYLSSDPDLLLSALAHYLANPEDRPELGTPGALERLQLR